MAGTHRNADGTPCGHSGRPGRCPVHGIDDAPATNRTAGAAGAAPTGAAAASADPIDDHARRVERHGPPRSRHDRTGRPVTVPAGHALVPGRAGGHELEVFMLRPGGDGDAVGAVRAVWGSRRVPAHEMARSAAMGRPVGPTEKVVVWEAFRTDASGRGTRRVGGEFGDLARATEALSRDVLARPR